jgi:hypothetical protein
VRVDETNQFTLFSSFVSHKGTKEPWQKRSEMGLWVRPSQAKGLDHQDRAEDLMRLYYELLHLRKMSVRLCFRYLYLCTSLRRLQLLLVVLEPLIRSWYVLPVFTVICPHTDAHSSLHVNITSQLNLWQSTLRSVYT